MDKTRCVEFFYFINKFFCKRLWIFWIQILQLSRRKLVTNKLHHKNIIEIYIRSGNSYTRIPCQMKIAKFFLHPGKDYMASISFKVVVTRIKTNIIIHSVKIARF